MEKEVEYGANYKNGVFYFSNSSDEDFVALWNNKEYIFPKNTCSPMIIEGCTPEEVQSIRKKWAYKWAEKQWYEGKEYQKMSKMGNGLPPTRNDSSLEPLIQECLNPLPVVQAEVKTVKRTRLGSKASKPISDKFDPKADFEVIEE